MNYHLREWYVGIIFILAMLIGGYYYFNEPIRRDVIKKSEKLWQELSELREENSD